jgi:hypothetical protein
MRALIAAIAVLLSLAGCHVLLPYTSSEADVGVPAADVGGKDVPELEGGNSVDLGQILAPELVCQPPQSISSGGLNPNLHEPAVRVNGLELLARSHGGDGWFKAVRGDVVDDFTAFSAAVPGYDKYHGDLSFFMDLDGTESAVIVDSIPDLPRRLVLCSDASSDGCPLPESIVVQDETNQLLLPHGAETDMDGPSVAMVGPGELLILFNVARFDGTQSDAATTDIYSASPLGGNLLLWTAAPVPGLSQVGVGEDDPSVAMLAGGSVIVFARHDGADWDLWYVSRAPDSDSFAEPRLLESVNTANEESDPEIFHPAVSSGLELFFSKGGSQAGTFEIHGARCVLAQPSNGGG